MRLDTLRTTNDSRRPAPLPGIAAALLALLVPVVLIACESSPLAPRPGLPEYRELATMPIAGPARLDLAGGNLSVSRTDLELDTQLGSFSVGAVWNSATRRWVWSFDDISFANGAFTDATGETHFVTPLAPETAIPGTIWVKQSQAGQSGPNRMRTKGGLEYTFTTSGRPLAIRWASSANPRLEFTQSLQGDGARHTSLIRQCVGSPVACHPVFTIHYDGAGRVREIVDRAGRRARFRYDALGNLVTARDGLDIDTNRPGVRYEYSGGDLTAITNSEGDRVEYAYDSARRLLQATQIGAGNPARSFVYRGKKTSIPYRTIATDPLGAVRTYYYDADHQLLAFEDGSAGETTRFTWGHRRVTSRTLPSGATTHWVYANDDVLAEVEPSGNVTSYEYQPDGVDRALPGRRPLLRRSDLLGTLEVRSYDTVGRLLSIANGAGDTLSLTYGDDQMVSQFTDSAGIPTLLTGYGEHGHPTFASRAGITRSFAYDAVGNLTEGPASLHESGPALGGIVSRGFDADRNVTVLVLSDLAIVSQASETLTTVFRSDGKPLLIARPGGGDAAFVYDELGRLVRKSERADGLWYDTALGYDAAGRVTSVDRANGMGQRWTYDSLGRMQTYAIRQGAVTEHFAAFGWEDGLLRRFADSRSGTEVYSYDGAARLSAVAYGNGDRATISWDFRSQRTGVALERGDGSLLRTLTISYDAAGRERGVYDNGRPILERTWSAGRLSRTDYGNGLSRRFEFDGELGTLAGIAMTAQSLAVENTTVQAADPECSFYASHCVSAHTLSGGGLPANTFERHHLMPGASDPEEPIAGQRVGLEDKQDAAPAAIYRYDALSNLRASPAGTSIYNGEGNRLQELQRAYAETVPYSYDAAGFTTSRGGVPMTWDGAGRLTSYGNASFTWDAIGRPVSRVIDGEQVTHRFGGLVEVDAAGSPAVIDLGEVKIDLAGSDTRYRHFDYRGNVKLVTDAAGDVVKHYEYSAYAVDAVYGADPDPRAFARGRAVGDLVLIGHRLYDPAAARFLAPDPIDQLINQYAYTLGNPVQFWDPSGAQAVSSNQTAGAMMQGAGNALSMIGAVTLGVGVGAVFVPAASVFAVATLIGIGVNFVVLGEGLKSIGGLLLNGGGGSAGGGGGFGAGPGLSAPGSFNDHVGPFPNPGDCGGDACAGGAGAPGLAELAALAGLGGPTSPGGGGGGGGCAPVAFGEGRLPNGSLALLLGANLVTAAIVWRRARIVRSVAKEI